ncbi:MAG: intracellular septation protein [Bacteroidia bacterium]|jgi:intracellular septation protein
MKLLLEFGPLLLFFIANKFFGSETSAGIIKATSVFMIALLIALPISWKTEGKLPVVPLITAAFVLFFGGLTVYFEDGKFIQIKPTAVGLFFTVLLTGGLLRGKLFLKMLLGEVLKLEDEGWRIMSKRWAGFFLALAVFNEVVRHNFSFDHWVTFKAFGILPLSLIFGMSQMSILQRYEIPSEEEQPEE